jgi:hypothetical protein
MKVYPFIVRSADKRQFGHVALWKKSVVSWYQLTLGTHIRVHVIAKRLLAYKPSFPIGRSVKCAAYVLGACMLRNACVMKGNQALILHPNALQILVWPCAAFMTVVREIGWFVDQATPIWAVIWLTYSTAIMYTIFVIHIPPVHPFCSLDKL